MKTTVVFHSADWDGRFCAEIAKKFLPSDTEFIGWNHGDDPLPVPDGKIYILDLPVDRVFGFIYEKLTNGETMVKFQPGANSQFFKSHNPFDFMDRVVWIDHHKSSIETHPTTIPGYRIDGVAACRLAWQWFKRKGKSPEGSQREYETPLPVKSMFVDRFVSEPWAVRLAGEYDIWDKRDPDAELFQHGLRSRELNDITWKYMLGDDHVTGNHCVDDLLEGGKVLQFARTNENASVIKEIGFTIEFEGMTFLACNAARYNSHLFTAGLKPEHDACFGFKWTGKNWSVSLYHAPGKEHHDLSVIAKKYGGGGHAGACGYQTNKLSFLA